MYTIHTFITQFSLISLNTTVDAVSIYVVAGVIFAFTIGAAIFGAVHSIGIVRTFCFERRCFAFIKTINCFKKLVWAFLLQIDKFLAYVTKLSR